jgi:hypothetical protein
MALTPEQFLNLDLGFPGISFGYESWALDSYLKVLEQQIEYARAQYRLRAEHELEKQKRGLDHAEYGSRLSSIDEAADAQIPRFFRIGAVVSIWGMFESFLTDFALYVGKREKIGLSFKDIRAESFRGQIEKYFEKVARISLPWSQEERECLSRLQDLRNFLAHRNGRLMDLPPESEKKVKDLASRIKGVSVMGSTVVVTPAYIAETAELVFGCVGKLSQQLADKYVQPVPSADA